MSMNEMREKCFGYSTFDSNGEKVILDRKGKYKDMLMDLTSFRLEENGEKLLYSERDELAIVLLQGNVEFHCNGIHAVAQRASFLSEGLYCLHVCRGVRVTIKALAASELVVAATENQRTFSPVMYTPKNTRENLACEGKWNNTAIRKVRTAFEYTDAPYSDLVLGETIMMGGCWSGYVPHYHAQPEVYYFRLENPDGFGASFVGEEVFKIKDGSFAAIHSNLVHPQVAAPGYPIYYLWLIRHLDENPWIRETCHNEAAHEWLL